MTDGRFPSLRRQLSAYKFKRINKDGGEHAYWYHPRFSLGVSADDLFIIQKNRQKRMTRDDDNEDDDDDDDNDNNDPIVVPKRTTILRDIKAKHSPPKISSTLTPHGRRASTKPDRFLENLRDMITKLSGSSLSSIARWGTGGKSFFIDFQHEKFTDTVKPWFTHNSPSTIRRQLHLYRFLKRKGTNGDWYHPRFQRSSSEADFRLIRVQSTHPHLTSKSRDRLSNAPNDNELRLSPTPIQRCTTPLGDENNDKVPAIMVGHELEDATLIQYFCSSCVHYGGIICCGNCPTTHHRNCTTSRCVSNIRNFLTENTV